MLERLRRRVGVVSCRRRADSEHATAPSALRRKRCHRHTQVALSWAPVGGPAESRRHRRRRLPCVPKRPTTSSHRVGQRHHLRRCRSDGQHRLHLPGERPSTGRAHAQRVAAFAPLTVTTAPPRYSGADRAERCKASAVTSNSVTLTWSASTTCRTLVAPESAATTCTETA